MKFLYHPIMLSPDDGVAGSLGGGAGSVSPVTANNPFEGSSPDLGTGNADTMPKLPTRVGAPEKEPEQLQQPEVVEKPVTPTGPVTLTPEQISELTAQTVLRVQGQQKPTPVAPVAKPTPPPLTDAEFNQRFGVVQADAKTYTDIFGFAPENPNQVKALNDYGQNLVRQTMRMVQFMQSQELAKVKGELTSQVSPLVQSHRSNMEREMRNEFFTQNPDLKDYGALIEEIVQNVQRSGQKFEGSVAEQKAAAFNFVAARARTFLGPNVSGQAAPQQVTGQQQQQVPQTQRRMTTMSMGGQSSGTGAATVNSRSSNDAKAIFG